MNSCPKCHHTHVAGDVVVAGSRFAPVTGYVAHDGTIHPTRADAQEWLCQKRQQRTPPASKPCDCPTSGLGYRHHRWPCPRAGENEPLTTPPASTPEEGR